MNFTKKYITPQYLWIIDIGSYKIRISACKFLNKKVTVLWYTEKRQDTSIFINQECTNLAALCEDIDDAIKKLEKESKVVLDKVVINFPFGELFVATKKINYKRSLPHTAIDHSELETIIRKAEEISLKKLSGEIYETSGIGKEEIELILSRINSFTIDKKVEKIVIGQEWENIRISVLNVFVPLSKHNLVNHIGNIIEKKIMRTLPSEFCLTKLFWEKNIMVLSLGATQTSISIKKQGELIWISKIGIGINDLLSKISSKTAETHNQVLEKLDSENYTEEKELFLTIWTESVLIGIKEIIVDEICPNVVWFFWGGSNNMFIKNALQNLSFGSHDIRIVKGVEFTQVDVHDFLEDIEPVSHDTIQHMNLDSLALILETNHILSREKDSVSKSLRNVVQELGYTTH